MAEAFHPALSCDWLLGVPDVPRERSAKTVIGILAREVRAYLDAHQWPGEASEDFLFKGSKDPADYLEQVAEAWNEHRDREERKRWGDALDSMAADLREKSQKPGTETSFAEALRAGAARITRDANLVRNDYQAVAEMRYESVLVPVEYELHVANAARAAKRKDRVNHGLDLPEVPGGKGFFWRDEQFNDLAWWVYRRDERFKDLARWKHRETGETGPFSNLAINEFLSAQRDARNRAPR
jgi:hypothetical protein